MSDKNDFELIAILGGAGFLGRHLATLIRTESPNAKVRLIDLQAERPDWVPPETEYLGRRNIQDRDSVPSAIDGADAVVNLVGLISYWRKDAGKLYDINQAGTKNVVDACGRVAAKRFVHVSSSAALGYNNDPASPIDESFEFDWDGTTSKPYMHSKRAGEEEACKAADLGVSVAVACPAAMYGPGDLRNTARLYAAVHRGAVKVVPPGGNSLVDVRDVARGLWKLLNATEHSGRFLFVGQNLSFVEIISTIATAVGKPVTPKKIPAWVRGPVCGLLRLIEGLLPTDKMVAPDDLEMGFMYRYASSRKAQNLLGWRPEFSFEQTAKDQADFLRAKGYLKASPGADS